MTGSVAVIGSVNQDVVCEVPRLPGPGETVLATGARTNAGGKGANQAVAAAKAGGRVEFVGRVGGDSAAVDLRDSMAAAGVKTTGLREVTGARTGRAYVTVASGENQIVVDPGANFAWESGAELSAMAEAELLAAADIVVAQLEIPVAVVDWAAGVARRFVLNAAPAAELGDELLRRCDPLVVNEYELATISGAPTGTRAQAGQAARSLCLRGAPSVVVTLGADGSILARRTADAVELTYQPAPQVVSVDSTGAGDAYVGALCTALADGVELGEAVAFATAAASLSVRSPGTHDSYPTREQVVAARTAVPRARRLDFDE
ncbi:ribokinase [Nocardia tenerifensis]|uniref:Ribokinase n=1 Tax=Nocardia tenerifensis TaxID=228006 RepID=A0A318KX79_9NOCA|nr:ribokinase [Nocardia tenerifensis]PXX69361.1 ribokinase [Nocardia tenerifensis]